MMCEALVAVKRCAIVSSKFCLGEEEDAWESEELSHADSHCVWRCDRSILHYVVPEYVGRKVYFGKRREGQA